MDETTTQSTRADDEQTADPLDGDRRRSHLATFAFPALRDGDTVELPNVTDTVYQVTDAPDDEGVAVLEAGDDTHALAESRDGSISFISDAGIQDVDRLVIQEGQPGNDENDGNDSDDGNDAHLDAVDLDDAEGDAGTVEITAVENGQVVLEGDTYHAKDDIKRVDYPDRDWAPDRKVWLVDADVVGDLQGYLNAAGFALVDARDPEGQDDETDDDAQRLADLADRVDVGDRIAVHYRQKNGEGENSKVGDVTNVHPAGEYPPVVAFRRDDGQTMRVKLDDHDDLSLFTGGYAPYVGEVQDVEIRD